MLVDRPGMEGGDLHKHVNMTILFSNEIDSLKCNSDPNRDYIFGEDASSSSSAPTYDCIFVDDIHNDVGGGIYLL